MTEAPPPPPSDPERPADGAPPPPGPPGYGAPPPPDAGYGAPPPPPPGQAGYQQGWQQPPPPYQQQGYPPVGYVQPGFPDPQAKSKIAAGLLGIFLGGFGVHRFYLGYTKIGVIQIVVTLVTCGIGSLWGFVEGILYLVGAGGYTTDSTGRPLRD